MCKLETARLGSFKGMFWFKLYFDCKFWSAFFPENDSPLILLYVKQVFSFLQIIIIAYTGQCLKRIERVGRTLSQEFLQDSARALILHYLWFMILGLSFDAYHLSKILSTGQKIYFYWKCPSNTKVADSIDKYREGLFFASINY